MATLPELLDEDVQEIETALKDFLTRSEATLALITMVMMVVNGLRLGGKAYIAHFCPGPLWLAPLLGSLCQEH
jgi:F0F1-type ATP synthase membrane subunit a